MQGEDFVFKVPKVTKRKSVRLYCHETLDDLDTEDTPRYQAHKTGFSKTDLGKHSTRREGIGIVDPLLVQPFSQRRNKSLMSEQKQFLPKYSGNKENSCASDVESVYNYNVNHNHTVVNSDTLLTNFSDGTWINPPRNLYTQVLLDELNANDEHQVPISLQDRQSQYAAQMSADLTTPVSSGTASQRATWPLDYEQRWNSGGIEISTVVPNVLSSYPDPGQDVLVVPDDCMADDDSNCSSDLDWESLTPPAPRSPSDHMVPDMDDPDCVTTPSDFIFYTYQRLGGPRENDTQSIRPLPPFALSRGPADIQNRSLPHHALDVSDVNDHVVPGFFF